jgi:hypothetical protein
MRRFLFVLVLIALPSIAAAQGPVLNVRDIVDLTKAGLGEEALIALIEVNRPVFPVDVGTLKDLKAAGVPPKVIVAMIKSGREAPPPPPPLPVDVPVVSTSEPLPPPPPPVVVIEQHERVREVPVAVPVYVAVPTRRVVDHPRRPAPKPNPVEPVYWGWGGKLRPDAWKPTAADVQKDAKVPLSPQRK